MVNSVEPNQAHESVLDILKNENICPEHKAKLEQIFAMSSEDQTA